MCVVCLGLMLNSFSNHPHCDNFKMKVLWRSFFMRKERLLHELLIHAEQELFSAWINNSMASDFVGISNMTVQGYLRRDESDGRYLKW